MTSKKLIIVTSIINSDYDIYRVPNPLSLFNIARPINNVYLL